MEVYPTICRLAHDIINEGLSAQIIRPEVTTTDDVEWWFRERVRALKLQTWFHPTVSVQRAATHIPRGDFSARASAETIRPGDLVHVDLGISYLRLNTDTKQHAYVLPPGETEAPDGLRRALQVGNRLQDILTSAFPTGRSGNHILGTALAQAREEGIDATIHTHPIGIHGHGAGPTIGLWDQQDGVPGRGGYPLFPDTAHSIELNATVSVPEWGGAVARIKLEEDAFFDGASVRFMDGRQQELRLIPSVNSAKK